MKLSSAHLERRLVFHRLLQQFDDNRRANPRRAWDFLAAAHIVGQTSFRLHCRVHWLMLCFAVRTRNGRETLGQLLRLGLVPLGHLMQRLPLGNTGRSNVSAFQKMQVAPGLQTLIAAATPSIKP